MGKEKVQCKTNYLGGQRPGAAARCKIKQNTSMSASLESRELSPIPKQVFFFFHCFDVLACFPKQELVWRDKMDVPLFDIEVRLLCSLIPTHNKQEGKCTARGVWCAWVRSQPRPEDSCLIHQDIAVSWAPEVSREKHGLWMSKDWRLDWH